MTQSEPTHIEVSTYIKSGRNLRKHIEKLKFKKAYWECYWGAKMGLRELEDNPYQDDDRPINEYWQWRCGFGDYEPSLLEVKCPLCQKFFLLGEANLLIASCESGGVYGCYVKCECGHKEEVF